MNLVVIDSNVIASWFLLDEREGEHSNILNHLDKIKIHTPSIFEHEFMNILLIAQRKGRIDHATQENILSAVSRYPIVIEPSSAILIENINVLKIARAYQLTVYDAAYLELSIRMGNIPLITYDKELLAVAQKLKIRTKVQFNKRTSWFYSP